MSDDDIDRAFATFNVGAPALAERHRRERKP